MRYNDLIVNRDFENNKIKALLHNSGRMIDEVVNYGSLLIDKIKEPQKFTEIHSGFQTLFVQFLSLIDSAAILVKHGHSDGLKPLVRSVLELSFNLQYMMEDDFNEKCVAYQVADVRGRIKEYRKFMNQSSDGVKLRELHAEIGVDVTRVDFQKLIDNLDNMLKREPYMSMNERYDEVKRGYSRLQQWYTVINPSLKTVRDLAEHLDQEIYYEVVYKAYSNYSHGGSSLKRVAHGDEKALVLPHVRHYDSIPETASILIGIVLRTIEQIVNNFVEGEIKSYIKWYEKEIRNDLIHLTRAEVKTSYKVK